MEEDDYTRSMVVEILASANYITLDASSAEEGLDILLIERPVLILLDLFAPVVTGWFYMRRLHDMAMRVPVIVLSSDEEWGAIAQELGAIGFVCKPFTKIQLLAAIAKYRW